LELKEKVGFGFSFYGNLLQKEKLREERKSKKFFSYSYLIYFLTNEGRRGGGKSIVFF
jgi:hypothetical protein